MTKKKKECKKSPDGEHCWHTSPGMLPSYPAQIHQICCWCGEGKTIRVPMSGSYTDKEHGEYFKTRLII